MPFKSQVQMRYLYAKHPKIAKRWGETANPGKLPERIGKYTKEIVNMARAKLRK